MSPVVLNLKPIKKDVVFVSQTYSPSGYGIVTLHNNILQRTDIRNEINVTWLMCIQQLSIHLLNLLYF